ncbi:MAG: amino-acid N-acetyltransferase, partial [Gammaproteobacteria bacterium]|nr:amino-acid N-acetyltransferase [Gammaproteobacteria bacterium]
MSDRPKNIDEFVAWFRNTSPYINAHRGKTFVVYFHGEVIGSDPYLGLIQDLILLNTLGVRIVLVHGAEPQIDTHLDALQIKTRRVNGLRITDNIVLPHVKAVLGSMRMDIETLLSRGVINTPNLGLQVHVAGGNFVTAQPLGVIDGVDFHHTGQVRKIDTQSISNRLSENNIVLLSPLGYSPTGEIFSLSGLELASKTAVALKADKLILLGEDVCIRDSDDSPIYQMNLREAEHRLEALSKSGNHSPRDFQFATEACRLGVRRVHLLDQNQDGALLIELFTRDGTGTLISSANYDTVRQATIDDIAGILELIRPLEESGVLVRRSRERLETEIDYFTVMERDGMIIACAA